MAEIKKILEKNDIAGFVVLHTIPEHSEFLNHLTTSYSCVVNDGEGVRFRLKQAEVGKEKAKLLAEGTYNMISHLADMIAQHAMTYIDMKEMLQKKWGGEDGEGLLTSHTQQNN